MRGLPLRLPGWLRGRAQADGRPRILFVHASSRLGSSGNYLQALGAGLVRQGAACLMLGEGRGKGSHDGVAWTRFGLRNGCIDAATWRRVRAFDPDLVVMVGVRTKAMLVALELRHVLGLPFFIQCEDDDRAPFERYYPGATAGVLEMLDMPAPAADRVAAFGGAVDWELTRALWQGTTGYRSVEPVLRALSFHLCDGIAAIWHPLAREMERRFGKAVMILPPVVDTAALAPGGVDASLRRRTLAKQGMTGDRTVLFVSGTIYDFSDEFRLFLHAVSEVAQRHPLALLLAGRSRLDTDRVLAQHLADTVPVANLGMPAWQRYLRFVEMADAICVPGVADEFNRLRLPGRIPVAMALAKPVFTFRHGFGESLEDGREAVLTRDDEVGHWTKQLERLCDAAFRKQMSGHARRFAEREFDAGTVAKRLLDYAGQPSRAASDLSYVMPLYRQLEKHWKHHGQQPQSARGGLQKVS